MQSALKAIRDHHRANRIMLSASLEVIILVAVGRLRAEFECTPTVLAGVGEDMEPAAKDMRVG